MLTKAVIRRAMDALRYKAANEAGQSQEPALFKREETQEWIDAGIIAHFLREPNVQIEDELTANQMIVLLMIHRGLRKIDEASHTGTYHHDIEHLVAKRLVRAAPADDEHTLWETTKAGHARVKDALGKI